MTAVASIEDVERRLRDRRYIGDRALATSIFLALQLQKPLFIEGEAGVGKTEAAKVMAEARDPNSLAPAGVPAVLKDPNCSMFMRANLGLAYARALAARKFHDEALEVLKLFQQYVIPNYTRYPVALTHGEGSYIWDAEGNRYLDLFPGWGCGLLGHCPAPVVEAVRAVLPELERIS